MVVVRGRLTPEVGAVLRRALEAACDQARRVAAAGGGAEEEAAAAAAGAEGEAADTWAGAAADAAEPTLAQRQADAIGAVAEAALAGGLDRGRPALPVVDRLVADHQHPTVSSHGTTAKVVSGRGNPPGDQGRGGDQLEATREQHVGRGLVSLDQRPHGTAPIPSRQLDGNGQGLDAFALPSIFPVTRTASQVTEDVRRLGHVARIPAHLGPSTIPVNLEDPRLSLA